MKKIIYTPLIKDNISLVLVQYFIPGFYDFRQLRQFSFSSFFKQEEGVKETKKQLQKPRNFIQSPFKNDPPQDTFKDFQVQEQSIYNENTQKLRDREEALSEKLQYEYNERARLRSQSKPYEQSYTSGDQSSRHVLLPEPYDSEFILPRSNCGVREIRPKDSKKWQQAGFPNSAIIPKMVLIGKPGVGKSTFYGSLTKEKRVALASDNRIGGFHNTRDWRENRGKISDLHMMVVDTSGFEPFQAIDSPLGIAIQHTKQVVETADIIVVMFSAESGISPIDEDLVALVQENVKEGQVIIPVLNKCESSFRTEKLTEIMETYQYLGLGEPVYISARYRKGIVDLYQVLQPHIDRITLQKSQLYQIPISSRHYLGRLQASMRATDEAKMEDLGLQRQTLKEDQQAAFKLMYGDSIEESSQKIGVLSDFAKRSVGARDPLIQKVNMSENIQQSTQNVSADNASNQHIYGWHLNNNYNQEQVQSNISQNQSNSNTQGEEEMMEEYMRQAKAQVQEKSSSKFARRMDESVEDVSHQQQVQEQIYQMARSKIQEQNAVRNRTNTLEESLYDIKKETRQQDQSPVGGRAYNIKEMDEGRVIQEAKFNVGKTSQPIKDIEDEANQKFESQDSLQREQIDQQNKQSLMRQGDSYTKDRATIGDGINHNENTSDIHLGTSQGGRIITQYQGTSGTYNTYQNKSQQPTQGILSATNPKSLAQDKYAYQDSLKNMSFDELLNSAMQDEMEKRQKVKDQILTDDQSSFTDHETLQPEIAEQQLNLVPSRKKQRDKLIQSAITKASRYAQVDELLDTQIEKPLIQIDMKSDIKYSSELELKAKQLRELREVVGDEPEEILKSRYYRLQLGQMPIDLAQNTKLGGNVEQINSQFHRPQQNTKPQNYQTQQDPRQTEKVQQDEASQENQHMPLSNYMSHISQEDFSKSEQAFEAFQGTIDTINKDDTNSCDSDDGDDGDDGDDKDDGDDGDDKDDGDDSDDSDDSDDVLDNKISDDNIVVKYDHDIDIDDDCSDSDDDNNDTESGPDTNNSKQKFQDQQALGEVMGKLDQQDGEVSYTNYQEDSLVSQETIVVDALEASDIKLPPIAPPALPAKRKTKDRVNESRPLRLCFVGTSNSGKSTLLNTLVGYQRALTGPIKGLTRDSIHLNVDYKGHRVVLVDTAGFRKPRESSAESELSYVRTKILHRDVIDNCAYCNVCAIVLDPKYILQNGKALTKLEKGLSAKVVELGRGIIFVINKMDTLVQQQRQEVKSILEQQLPKTLQGLRKIPVIAISALDGTNVNQLLDTALKVHQSWKTMIDTHQLNDILNKTKIKFTDKKSSAISRLKYISQVADKPPQFYMFVKGRHLLKQNNLNQLSNFIHQYFEFDGVPIRIQVSYPHQQLRKSKIEQADTQYNPQSSVVGGQYLPNIRRELTKLKQMRDTFTEVKSRKLPQYS